MIPLAAQRDHYRKALKGTRYATCASCSWHCLARAASPAYLHLTDKQLKYYGGRSIFSSLYESPAERKRASLRELFEAFPKARFVMLGDSAEQDLELYIEFARLYEGQVALIAIRDVTSDRADGVLMGMQGGTSGSGSSSGASTPVSGEMGGAGMPGGLEGMGVGHHAKGQTSGEKGVQGSVAHVATEAAIRAGEGLPGASVSASSPDGTATPPTLPPRPAIRPTASSTSISSLLSEITEDDLKSLSSSQQKILQRAATWNTRMETARLTTPGGTGLVFFKEASEVEGRIEEVLSRGESGKP